MTAERLSYTDKMDPTPKRVVQAARGIQTIIDHGKPGDRLPSEVELAKKLTVSRATVRDALTRLWLQGLITRRWGVGTFISERHAMLDAPMTSIYLDLEEVGSLPSRIIDAGHSPTITSFTLSTVEPPKWVADEFKLEAGQTMRSLERCIAIDGHPALVIRDYFPQLVNGQELEVDSLAGLSGDFPTAFRSAGLRLVKQAARLHAQIPDQAVAELLGIPETEPVLHAEQRSYAETGELVIGTDSYYISQIFGLVTVRILNG